MKAADNQIKTIQKQLTALNAIIGKLGDDARKKFNELEKKLQELRDAVKSARDQLEIVKGLKMTLNNLLEPGAATALCATDSVEEQTAAEASSSAASSLSTTLAAPMYTTTMPSF
jgi:predicted nuclease with TOPRIM domain